MNLIEFNRTQVIKYLILTFSLAYLIQIGVWLLFKSGYAMIGQLVMALMMFVPTLGVLFSGHGIKRVGWNPKIKKNIRLILIAWLFPAVLAAAGAALYFLIFPGHLDLSGGYLSASSGTDIVPVLEEQGITYPLYVLISLVCSITYAPLLNALTGLGEEIGWRGFLYPQLKARFGRTKGWILGGVIWGMWHWPLIWLIGYEYGAAAGNAAGYFGSPVTGMIVFCVFTVALGILCDWLYERSGSIWLPSVCHGAVNAVFGIPLMICLTDTGSARLLGPAPNGLIAGIPLIITAVILLLRGKKEDDVA